MRPRAAIIAAALVAASTSTAMAIPYASGIRVGSTAVTVGVGTTITYNLNHSAATATIEIRDSGNAVVATFPGTTTAGVNTVNWDGTNNNAGGTPVVLGSGYRVRVAVTGTEAAGWVRYKANGSPTSNPILGDSDMISDWFPKGCAVNTDPESDFFGSVMVGFGYGTLLPAAGVIEFRSDLEVKAGDNGLASRVLRHPGDDGVAPEPATYTVWGLFWDTSVKDLLWYSGQATTGNPGAKEYMNGLGIGGVMPQVASDADPATVQPNGLLPRTIAIHEYVGTRYAFISRGTGVLEVLTVNASNNFATLVGNILATEFDASNQNRYSKGVCFDAAGNLYWISNRVIGATPSDGRIYRWDAATVQAAIANPVTAPLTNANAAWIVINDIPTQGRIPFAAIAPDGGVYAISGQQGVYLVGNTSTATLNLNMSTLPATPLIDKSLIRPPSNITDAGCGMQFDAVGNLHIAEGGAENIIAFSPGGASSNAFTAPPSQTFDIQAPPSLSRGWEMYR